MLSPKIYPGLSPAPVLTKIVPTRPRLVRRGKNGQALGLSINTDVFELDLPEGAEGKTPKTPTSAATESTVSSSSATESGASTPSTVHSSPPSSVCYSGDTTDEAAPQFFKIAAWVRDVSLPAGESPNVDAAAITLEPSGARVTKNAMGKQVLLVANPAEIRHDSGLRDLLHFGFTRFATRLSFDVAKNKLGRTRMDGKKAAVRSGTYAFVIDQDGDVVMSLTSSPKEGAPAGAHMNLVAGLPVLFAGELTIDEGRIVSYSPMSGSYRTPSCQREVAARHPLLQDAQLNAPDSWDP